MSGGLTLSSAPAAEPLTLAQAKLHLKVDDDITEDDDLISSLITAARTHAELLTGRAFVTQTWVLTLDRFPQAGHDPDCWELVDDGNYIQLPKSPVQSITSIKYYDTDGTQQTWSSSNYLVDIATQPCRIEPAYGQIWPTPRVRKKAVEITYICGYGAYTAVPDAIKTAMKLMIGHWYSNREASVIGTIVADLPLAVESILAGYVVGNYP